MRGGIAHGIAAVDALDPHVLHRDVRGVRAGLVVDRDAVARVAGVGRIGISYVHALDVDLSRYVAPDEDAATCARRVVARCRQVDLTPDDLHVVTAADGESTGERTVDRQMDAVVDGREQLGLLMEARVLQVQVDAAVAAGAARRRPPREPWHARRRHPVVPRAGSGRRDEQQHSPENEQSPAIGAGRAT